MPHVGQRKLIAKLGQFGELSANPTFSLRWFLLVAVGFAVLCGMHEFGVAILIALYAAVYYTLLGSGLFVARFTAASRDRFAIRFGRDDSFIPVLFTVTLLSLPFHFLWHSPIYMLANNPAGDFFSPPVWLGLSLYSLQRLIHILVHVALYLAWLGNCWTSGRVSATECRTATATSFLLFCSYLAHPRAVELLMRLFPPIAIDEPPP
jgi:hypothetical protein